MNTRILTNWPNIDYIKELLLFVMWNNDAIIMLLKNLLEIYAEIFVD